MKDPQRTSNRDDVLDLIRGICAILVVSAHIRAFIFCDYSELDDPNLLTTSFYFITGIHHQAVMIFFVLSGYFVGGGALRALAENQFSWLLYASARLTRLWIVLLPALALTFIVDRIGISLNPDAYAGAFHEKWLSGPSISEGANHNLTTLLANVFFFQTIITPVYGTNGPLWSLANEFWYYVLFPIFAWSLANITGNRRARAAATFAIGCALVLWLPNDILEGGLIWMMGVAACFIRSRYRTHLSSLRFRMIFFAASGLAFFGTLALSKIQPHRAADLQVGIMFSIWMVFFPTTLIWPSSLESIGRFTSSISYTLYVSHFPALFLFSACVLEGKLFNHVPVGLIWFVILFFSCVLLALILWWLFERNTDRIRRVIQSRLPHRTKPNSF